MVLAYLNVRKEIKEFAEKFFDGSIYPEIEKIPLKFAILERNKIMVKRADFLIFYCTHPGRTRELLDFAKQKGKAIMNIGDFD